MGGGERRFNVTLFLKKNKSNRRSEVVQPIKSWVQSVTYVRHVEHLALRLLRGGRGQEPLEHNGVDQAWDNEGANTRGPAEHSQLCHQELLEMRLKKKS